MQYKVPQNVDIEDKVIAGLTLRQFMFLMIAAGIVLILKYALIGALSFLFMPVALIVGSAGAALAFVKINDRPLEIFIASAAKSVITPNRRFWDKDTEMPEAIVEEKKPEIAEEEQKQSLKDVRSNLQRLAMIVDSGNHGLVEDRESNVKASTGGDYKVQDLLEKTEQSSARLDKYINQAKEQVATQTKEQPVSSLASVQPNQNNFEYEQIQTASENKLEEILEKAEQKEKEKELKLENAKIIKH